jgi:hypothetical protein
MENRLKAELRATNEDAKTEDDGENDYEHGWRMPC